MNDETTIRIIPVDHKDGKAIDVKLGAAVQGYCMKEFGNELNLALYYKVWAVLAVRVTNEDYFNVIGVSAIRYVADCQIFHVTAPTQDRDGLRIAMQARDMMIFRMYGYLEDLGQRGGSVLIYVAEKAQEHWGKFLEKIKAKKAERYELQIR